MPTAFLLNIDVDDLNRAIAFYTHALGLRLGRRLFSGTVAEMVGGPTPIYLLAKPAGTAVSTATGQKRDYHRHWTPVHLDFVVSNLDESVQTASAAGARIEGEIQIYSWGRISNLADPFGNGFCLIEFRGDGYDSVAA
jgi:predicted enzyme related to lactoylglutathione lyase